MLTKRLKQNILSTTILIENNKNIYGTSMKNTQDSVLGTQTYNLFSLLPWDWEAEKQRSALVHSL